MEQIFYIVRWWVVLETIGILALPLSSYILNKRTELGISISKILGILLVAYFSWIFGIVGFAYGTASLIISLFFLGLLSLYCILKKDFQIKASSFLLYEGIFSSSLIVFLIIRSLSPYNYFIVGEKFMDTAFINAVLRSTEFPLFDPWFAGEYANYYYFGYLTVGNLITLTDSPLSIGFNIASAAFYAISFTTSFGIGYGLTSRIHGGFITAFFVLIMGNLVGFFQLIVILLLPAYHIIFHVHGANVFERLSEFNFWKSQAIIPGTTVQFPFYSFFVGDLHPNYVSIPFQLLALMIVINIFRAKHISKKQLIILGLSVGVFYPLNTWNYPVYILLVGIALLSRKERLAKRFMSLGAVLIISFIAYFPHYLAFRSVYKISIVTANRTEITHYVMIFGFFLFLLIAFLVKEYRNFPFPNINSKKIIILSAVSLSYILVSFTVKFQLLILFILLALSFVILNKEHDSIKQAVIIFIIMGISLSLFAEVFYVEDTLNSTPYFRFNTVYKLYDQIWIFYAIAASNIFWHLRHFHKSVAIASSIFIVASMVFPIAAVSNKSFEIQDVPTLDGEVSIKKSYPYEYEAIEWFRNISGTPVVLEAPGYTGAWSSYISTFTGLPTVLGWEWHEYQWRMNLDEIEARRIDVERVYTTSNYDDITEVLDKYNIKYIYIGPVERDRYERIEIAQRDEEMFKLVLKNREVEIYEVQ